MFTTDRLILRAYRSEDEPKIHDLCNDMEGQSTLTDQFIVPRDQKYIDEMLKSKSNNALLFTVIETKDSREFVGIASLNLPFGYKNRDTSFGISLSCGHRNKGYGTEATKFIVDHAFGWLGMHRVTLHVFSGNQGAIKVYKKIGFIEEGRMRKANWTPNGWEDIVIMAILEEDWTRPS
ncbi:acyl-CoA N-acyltransferase [Mycena floridula]|nr:acyl-CoA N-acyltransferase [Mycena floridula]